MSGSSFSADHRDFLNEDKDPFLPPSPLPEIMPEIARLSHPCEDRQKVCFVKNGNVTTDNTYVWVNLIRQ